MFAASFASPHLTGTLPLAPASATPVRRASDRQGSGLRALGLQLIVVVLALIGLLGRSPGALANG